MVKPKVLIAALVLISLPGGALAQARPAPKSPPKPAAAKPAAGRFDARDPVGLIALLAEMDAKAEIARTAEHQVFLTVATPAFGFGVQFVDCDANGKACKAVAFSTASEKRNAALAQLNSFNQTSLTCRVYHDKAGKAHVMYAAVLSPSDTREELKMHVGVWQGCLGSFGRFLNDPPGYLAAAP